MPLALLYTGLALLLAFVSWHANVWLLQILLAWAALSLLVVSSAYLFNSAGVFRKRQDGSMPWFSRWLFVPFLFGAGCYNLFARRTDRVPPMQRVANGLFLGARLTRADLPMLRRQRISAVLDVTAEFAALDELNQTDNMYYLNIPVLDHACPTYSQLTQAVRWLTEQRAQGRKVLVHCALGRGRSVLVMAAYLLSRHNSKNTARALALIKQVRHTARLNRRQLKALHHFVSHFNDSETKPVWLIVNAVSGGGKWRDAKADIVELLSPFMQLDIHFTDQNTSAHALAQHARQAGCKLVIACGGDGTVTEVASALVGTDVCLGIIPLGTTNALSHALWGISSKLMPVRTACLNILDGQQRAIDTARCNGHLMLLLTGIGFEQQMVASADRQRKNELGQLAYLDGFWQAVQGNTILPLKVSFDNAPEQQINTASLVVANAAPFTTLLAQGSGEPDLTDGKLDITWLTAENGDSQYAGIAELALAGLTRLNPGIASQTYQASRVRIQRQDGKKLDYVIDGELFSDQQLDICIQPASLNVMLAEDDTESI